MNVTLIPKQAADDIVALHNEINEMDFANAELHFINNGGIIRRGKGFFDLNYKSLAVSIYLTEDKKWRLGNTIEFYQD